ncbi:unnamed protein product [Amoebophrya sp. A120]|nr:unnamed protein product [Amoebophrya sp. A120]|eukprot:GSA120T00022749001.1
MMNYPSCRVFGSATRRVLHFRSKSVCLFVAVQGFLLLRHAHGYQSELDQRQHDQAYLGSAGEVVSHLDAPGEHSDRQSIMFSEINNVAHTERDREKQARRRSAWLWKNEVVRAVRRRQKTELGHGGAREQHSSVAASASGRVTGAEDTVGSSLGGSASIGQQKSRTAALLQREEIGYADQGDGDPGAGEVLNAGGVKNITPQSPERVTASSEAGEEHEASKAIDRDVLTEARTGDSATASNGDHLGQVCPWMQIEFPRPMAVTEVKLTVNMNRGGLRHLWFLMPFGVGNYANQIQWKDTEWNKYELPESDISLDAGLRIRVSHNKRVRSTTCDYDTLETDYCAGHSAGAICPTVDPSKDEVCEIFRYEKDPVLGNGAGLDRFTLTGDLDDRGDMRGTVVIDCELREGQFVILEALGVKASDDNMIRTLGVAEFEVFGTHTTTTTVGTPAPPEESALVSSTAIVSIAILVPIVLVLLGAYALHFLHPEKKANGEPKSFVDRLFGPCMGEDVEQGEKHETLLAGGHANMPSIMKNNAGGGPAVFGAAKFGQGGVFGQNKTPAVGAAAVGHQPPNAAIAAAAGIGARGGAGGGAGKSDDIDFGKFHMNMAGDVKAPPEAQKDKGLFERIKDFFLSCCSSGKNGEWGDDDYYGDEDWDGEEWDDEWEEDDGQGGKKKGKKKRKKGKDKKDEKSTKKGSKAGAAPPEEDVHAPQEYGGSGKKADFASFKIKM